MESRNVMVSYAQNFEDVLLQRVFGDQATGYYVDVGAHDPVQGSVTKHFYDRGWRGVNIEPGVIFDKLQQARPEDRNYQQAVSDHHGEVTFYEYPLASGLNRIDALSEDFDDPKLTAGCFTRKVCCRPLAAILQECQPAVIDFLKVDTEGHERHVLMGNDWGRFRPRVVLVEATETNSPEPNFQTWEHLLIDANYLFAFFDGLNRFYVRVEDRPLLERFRVPVNVFDSFCPHQVVHLLALARAQEKDLQHYRDLLADTGGRALNIGLAVARWLRRLGNAGRASLRPWRRRSAA